MKCIKCIKVAKGYELDEIRRIDDRDAEERVKGGYWKYVPKSEWKLATRKPKTVQVMEQVADQATDQVEKQSKKKKVKA